jgi:hypothetical protein
MAHGYSAHSCPILLNPVVFYKKTFLLTPLPCQRDRLSNALSALVEYYGPTLYFIEELV